MQPATTRNSTTKKFINNAKRKAIALDAIQNVQSVTQISQQHGVSRKCVYKQKTKAANAIEKAFEKKENKKDKVLFYLPVTRHWIVVFVICLLMHARCSYRGVIKIMRDAFDYHISIGHIHNMAQEAIDSAQKINAKQDLNCVTLAAHDEIFHHNQPILVGLDIPSLYCHLLSLEDHRDKETWAIRLWDLEQQGFNPERIFGDDADGLRFGHQLAVSHIPYHLDHFHVSKKLMEVRRFFRNRLKSAVSYHALLSEKMEKAKIAGHASKYCKKLGLAKQQENMMRHLSESIDTLVSWLEHDILAMTGPKPEVRHELYDFIISEFKQLETLHPHRIKEIRVTLENQKPLLLSFSEVLNTKFQIISKKNHCALDTVWKMCELLRCKIGGDQYAIRSLPLQDLLEEKFETIEDAVMHAMCTTERTSSMVENLNSRLRPFFSSRQKVDNRFLELLRFYLNHTTFLRSEHQHRKDKTPTEILTGKPHLNWLEMLGFKRFKQAV